MLVAPSALRPEKGDKSNLPRSGPEGASHKLDLSPFSGRLRAELLRVLHPEGKAILGDKEIVKPFPEGTD